MTTTLSYLADHCEAYRPRKVVEIGSCCGHPLITSESLSAPEKHVLSLGTGRHSQGISFHNGNARKMHKNFPQLDGSDLIYAQNVVFEKDSSSCYNSSAVYSSRNIPKTVSEKIKRLEREVIDSASKLLSDRGHLVFFAPPSWYWTNQNFCEFVKKNEGFALTVQDDLSCDGFSSVFSGKANAYHLIKK